MNKFTEKNGKEKGPTSVIMAGTHGNEICGVKAFKELLPKLEIQRGKVIFLLGNIKAIKKNKRYTEQNLNRMFRIDNKYSKEIKKSYEYKRAQQIKKYLDQSDAMLDIHSTWNKCEPFIIAEKNAEKITNKLPHEFVRIVKGIDNIQKGGTDGYMYLNNKIGICVECGQHKKQSSVLNAQNAILSFLKSRNHIDGKQKDIKRKSIGMKSIYYTKTNSFKLVRKFKDFERINKGESVAIDGDRKILSPGNFYIVFAHDRKKKGEEGFLLAK